MKKNIYKIFLSVLSFSILLSCSDDEDLKMISNGSSSVLSTDIQPNIVLDDVTKETILGDFIWTKSTYSGTSTTINYDLEVVVKDTTGNDITPKILSTGDITQSFSGEILNAILDNKAYDIDPMVDGALSFRVKSYVGTKGLPQYSNIISINYLARTIVKIVQPKFSTFFLVGNATVAGWDNANGLQPLFKDAAASTTYSHSGYFTAGEFKVIAESGNWQPQYGDAAGALGVNDGSEGSSDPASFVIPSDGNYAFEMDTAAMTYTLTAIDDATLTEYTSIGIIGDATEGGWDADTDLVQSSFDKHIWYISDLVLKDGNVKFRANDAWDVSWGGSEVDYGIGTTANGPDIPQTAGTYDVIFNDITGAYIILKK